MRKLSIIITNYNTRDVLEECLVNLEGVYPVMEVIVVDNASKDDSVAMVKEKFRWVDVIESENKGIAHACNLGMHKATGDLFLFLGTDTFPKQAGVLGCIKYLESHADVGAVTTMLVTRDGKLDMDAHRGFPTPWTSLTHFIGLGKLMPSSLLFNSYFLGLDPALYDEYTALFQSSADETSPSDDPAEKSDPAATPELSEKYKLVKEPHEVDLCISHFMMVKKEVFDRIGTWDETFFVYGEDVDICYRIKQAGYKIMYLPQWQTLHYKGVTVGTRKETQDISTASPETRSRMKKASIDAMRLFYKKHFERLYPWVVNQLVYLGISLMELMRSK